MTPETQSNLRLGPFTVGDWFVEPKACRLSRGESVLKVRPQLIDLLLCLARRRGEIVLKEEIQAEVWAAAFIAESGLSRCVAELRQLLQDDAQHPRFIETIPKRGYRLIAPVTWRPEERRPDQGPTSVPPASEAEGVTALDGAGQARGCAGQMRGGDRPAQDAAVWAPGGAAQPEPRWGLTAARRASRGRRARAWMVSALIVLVVAFLAVVMLRRTPAKVLTERDTVVLAFENRTGDAAFDEAVPLAMAIQMEQSPYLGLPSPGRIQEVLRMMKRPPDTPVTRAVGMEICERVGGRALIVTSVASLGPQYAIGLEAVACGTGEVLARRQVTTDRRERVLDALQQAAAEIRRAVGEPAASLAHYSVPLVEATTASLEALRALRRGDVARERGQFDAALGHYREAVSLDPAFALAWSRLGRVLRVLGTEQEVIAAFEKAYGLRQRATFPERVEIEAAHHQVMTGEQAKVVEALELLKRTYPRRASIRRSLSWEHLRAGRYDLALTEALEGQHLEPTSPAALDATARAYLCLNRVAEARATAQQAIAVGGVAPQMHLTLLQCALADGRQDALARERAWAAEHPDVAPLYFLETEAEEAFNRGRLRAALDLLQQFETLTRTTGGPTLAASLRLRIARFEALAGLRAAALRRVRDELRRGLPAQLTIDAVKVTVSAEDFGLTARLLDEIEARGPSSAQPQTTFVQAYRAAVDTSRGRPDLALARLAPLEPFELGFAYGFIPLYERAQAHFRAGDWARARAAFEKILRYPTIDSGRKLLPAAQLGLARTLARAGDAAGSRRVYEQLFERWKDADADLPVLLEARHELDALAVR